MLRLVITSESCRVGVLEHLQPLLVQRTEFTTPLLHVIEDSELHGSSPCCFLDLGAAPHCNAGFLEAIQTMLKTPSGKLRARALGIPFGGRPGPLNSITDVAGR